MVWLTVTVFFGFPLPLILVINELFFILSILLMDPSTQQRMEKKKKHRMINTDDSCLFKLLQRIFISFMYTWDASLSVRA